LETGQLSDTNSASQKFASGCVEACPLDVLHFSSCGGTGDTYFRLYDSFASEVVWNDDGCGAASGPSVITYSVSESSICQNYCLHVGCFSDHACSANVTLQLYKAAQAPSRLLSFKASNDISDPSNSSLTLHGLAIHGFGAPYGGILHSTGQLGLTISHCEFRGSVGFYGGAIYVTNNSLAVHVASSVFSSTTAVVSGGAIYVGRNVTRLSVSDCSFYNASARGSGDEDGGGAVYIGEGNHDAVIRAVMIRSCSAPLANGGGLFVTRSLRLLIEDVTTQECSAKVGGSISFGTGCSNAVLRNVQVSRSSALRYGGAVSMWAANQRVRMTAVSIDQCTAASGGGQYVRYQNNFLSLSEVNVTRCSARFYDGGGVYIYVANLNVSAESVLIQQCTARTNGGGLYLDSNNTHLTMRGVDITACTASRGGGVYLYSANEHVHLSEVRIDQCSAELSGGGLRAYQLNNFLSLNNVSITRCSTLNGNGGGVNLLQSNHDVALERVFIRRCTATSYGGGIYLDSENVRLSLRDVDIAACTAAYGGGIFLYSANDHVRMSAVRIDQCSAARSGGGLRVHLQNNFLSLYDVRVKRCSARDGSGGGVHLYQANLNASIRHVTIEDCNARDTGGGVLVDKQNHFFLLREVQITRCAADYGGGMALFTNNTHADVEELQIGHCSAAVEGGGLLIEKQNHFLRVLDLRIVRCHAEQAGGLQVNVDNLNITMETVVVDGCSASEFGGGMYVVSGNDYFLLRDASITWCDAFGGGGIALKASNRHVQLVRVVIDQCSAGVSGGLGGGMYVSSQNDYLTLLAVRVTNCESDSQGGGIYSLRNNDLTIANSSIENCIARYAGGGLLLSDVHVNVVIVDSSISYNTARGMGGGIASVDETRGLVISGCVLSSNEATGEFGMGGGVYLASGHFGFALLSEQSYRHRTVIETRHPYEFSDQLLVNRTVAIPGAVGYYLYFDRSTKIGASDTCSLYATQDDEGNATVFHAESFNWPGINGPPQHWLHSTLTFTCTTYSYPRRTTISDNYNGIKLFVVPVFTDAQGTTVVEGNAAGMMGGGLYMCSREQFPILIGVQFRNNVAGGDGGGMYLRNEIIGMVAHQLEMEGNRAQDGYGGGICASTGIYGMQFQNCTFTNNSAGYVGGALAFVNNNGDYGDLSYGNDNVLSSSSLSLNSAAVGGGAVYLGTACDLTIVRTEVSGNTVNGDGGGILLSRESHLTARRLTVSHNWAGNCGGGIAVGGSSVVTLSNSTLSNNVAFAKGGAFCAKGGSLLMITDAEIFLNVAHRVGGGLYCSGSMYPVIRDAVIDGNAAHWGSALYLNGIVPSENSTSWDVRVAGNQATVGTVYWINGTMPEPVDLTASLTYDGNSVLFGQDVATQAAVLLVPEEINVQHYGSFLNPPTELALFDWYGELSPANSSAYVEVNIEDGSAEQCNGRPPFLSGADVSAGSVGWQEGVAVMGSLGVTCYPGSNITLQFTAYLADQVDLPTQQQSLSAVTSVYFRSCQVGEHIDSGMCVVCANGTYSLDDIVTAATRCRECPSNSKVESCHGAEIVLKRGYWRRHPKSETILSCLEEVDGCAGGNAAGDASCRGGHKGPLCSVCDEGSYLSDARCRPCAESDRLVPAGVLYVTLAAGVIGVVLAVLFYKSSRIYSGNASSVWESLYNVVAWLTDELKSLQTQIKILITTFQICTTVHVSMKVKFPWEFMRYLDAMSVVNLNVVALVPLSCVQKTHYTFIDKLLVVTLAPIGLSLLIAVLGTVEYQYSVHRHQGALNVKEELNQVTSRYLTMFLFLTYLVLPYVATTIFQTFLCTNVDPDSSDDYASDLYLTADMRISCDSDYYRRGVIYAALMAVLYVGGIPFMYALLLYRSRNEIAGRFTGPPLSEDSVEPSDTIAVAKADVGPADIGLAASGGKPDKDDEAGQLKNYLEKRTDPAALQARMISFLYEAYEPQFWYWEVVDTTRRLVLTAVLSVCGAGTAGQAILALLVSQLYIKLYGHYRPYVEDKDDLEAEVGQYQIFLTFLGALICQRHLLSSEYEPAVTGVLIAINTSVTIMFTRNVLLKLRDDLKNLRNYTRVLPLLAHVGRDCEQNKEPAGISEKDGEATVGAAASIGAVGAGGNDAVRPAEAVDLDDDYYEVEMCGIADDLSSVGSVELGEEVV
jgi:hypothetical protein